MSHVQIDRNILSESANKTVLVTGAARGIGGATASLFNKHGANIIIADLETLRDTAENLIATEFAYPERAVYIPADIVDWAQLTACFKRAISRFGGIDIVVANAGIMESSPVLNMGALDENGDLCESTDAQRVFDVNLRGTLNTLRLGLFYMQKSKNATSSPKSIVLVASTSAYFGGTGVVAYCASKHGVLGLLRSSQMSAQELGVRVNGVAPFFTPTHITAGFARKWSEEGLEENSPESVAEAVALVALDEGRKGECVLVAGQYLRELEATRAELVPTWLGQDLMDFMGRAMRFIISIGGYVLPKKG